MFLAHDIQTKKAKEAVQCPHLTFLSFIQPCAVWELLPELSESDG